MDPKVWIISIGPIYKEMLWQILVIYFETFQIMPFTYEE
jgi:hypothetical protein